MARHGLTLLELLLALAMLLTMAALSLPVVAPMLDDRAFDQASDLVLGQLRLAAAHARATGEPVEVLFVEPSPTSASIEGQLRALRFDPQMPRDAKDVQVLAISEAWARRTLPASITIDDRPPEELTGFEPVLAEESTQLQNLEEIQQRYEDRFGTDALANRPRTLRVAIFLPDGAAIVPQTLYLHNDDGRALQLDVDSWTSHADLKPIAANNLEQPDEWDADTSDP